MLDAVEEYSISMEVAEVRWTRLILGDSDKASVLIDLGHT